MPIAREVDEYLLRAANDGLQRPNIDPEFDAEYEITEEVLA